MLCNAGAPRTAASTAWRPTTTKMTVVSIASAANWFHLGFFWASKAEHGRETNDCGERQKGKVQPHYLASAKVKSVASALALAHFFCVPRGDSDGGDGVKCSEKPQTTETCNRAQDGKQINCNADEEGSEGSRQCAAQAGKRGRERKEEN